MNDLYDLVYNPFVNEDGTTVSLEKSTSGDIKRWDKSCVEHGYSFSKTKDPSHIIWKGDLSPALKTDGIVGIHSDLLPHLARAYVSSVYGQEEKFASEFLTL